MDLFTEIYARTTRHEVDLDAGRAERLGPHVDAVRRRTALVRRAPWRRLNGRWSARRAEAIASLSRRPTATGATAPDAPHPWPI
jgi:hypothetical protein